MGDSSKFFIGLSSFYTETEKQNPTAGAIGKSIGSVFCGGYSVVEPIFSGFR